MRGSHFKSFLSKALIFILSLAVFLQPTSLYAKGLSYLPQPGQMVSLSSAYNPAMIEGITIDPTHPFKFDFIIDAGESSWDTTSFKGESEKLIRFFLSALTTPEDDLWVNLSPTEKDRIIADDLIKTEMGQTMLSQDYILKQITSSLIYPESELGKAFWNKVYAKAQQEYGHIDIPNDTFHKVWIMPDTAKLYTHENTVYVVESSLKVMLDLDYRQQTVDNRQDTTQEHKDTKTQIRHSAFNSPHAGDFQRSSESHGILNQVQDAKGLSNVYGLESEVSTNIMKKVILPVLQEEVNTGKHFAPLRQIYHALILAKWYKEHVKDALINQVYSNQNKVLGVDLAESNAKEKIYQKYIQAYKQGVFNYIKEEQDPITKDLAPRKYFSGGLGFAGTINLDFAASAQAKQSIDQVNRFKVSWFADKAMLGKLKKILSRKKKESVARINVDFEGSDWLEFDPEREIFRMISPEEIGGLFNGDAAGYYTLANVFAGKLNQVVDAKVKETGGALLWQVLPIDEQNYQGNELTVFIQPQGVGDMFVQITFSFDENDVFVVPALVNEGEVVDAYDEKMFMEFYSIFHSQGVVEAQLSSGNRITRSGKYFSIRDREASREVLQDSQSFKRFTDEFIPALQKIYHNYDSQGVAAAQEWRVRQVKDSLADNDVRLSFGPHSEVGHKPEVYVIFDFSNLRISVSLNYDYMHSDDPQAQEALERIYSAFARSFDPAMLIDPEASGYLSDGAIDEGFADTPEKAWDYFASLIRGVRHQQLEAEGKKTMRYGIAGHLLLYNRSLLEENPEQQRFLFYDDEDHIIRLRAWARVKSVQLENLDHFLKFGPDQAPYSEDEKGFVKRVFHQIVSAGLHVDPFIVRQVVFLAMENDRFLGGNFEIWLEGMGITGLNRLHGVLAGLLKYIHQEMEANYSKYDVSRDMQDVTVSDDKEYENLKISYQKKKFLSDMKNLMQIMYKKVFLSDKAMNVDLNKSKSLGGIDFNPNNIQYTYKGKEINFSYDPAQAAQWQDVDGFVPVIFSITPISNMLPLLGLENNNAKPYAAISHRFSTVYRLMSGVYIGV